MTFRLLLSASVLALALSASAQTLPDSLRAPVALADTLPLLTAGEATALLLRQNPRVAIARLDTRLAENDATLGNADFLPTVSVNATQRRLAGGTGGFASDRDPYTLDAGVNARVTVFEGLSRLSRYRRLGTLARAAAFTAEATSESLLADALVTYYDVAAQQQQVAVRRAAVALSEERLRIAEGRRDVGVASELEVRRAIVDLNADRAALLRQQTTLARTKTTLDQLLGRTTGLDYRVTDSVAVDSLLTLATLEEAARQSAPEVQAARIAESAAALDLEAVRREVWPRIDLTAGYALGDATGFVLRPAQTSGFTYGLTATFDVFDGNDRRRRTQNARLRQEQQALATRQTTTATLTALRSAYALYSQSLALVTLESENVAVAQQNAFVALERFRLGVSTSLELREVQRALIDAESRLVAARFDVKAAEVDLLALAGLLL